MCVGLTYPYLLVKTHFSHFQAHFNNNFVCYTFFLILYTVAKEVVNLVWFGF